jgi:hypothetical protein
LIHIFSIDSWDLHPQSTWQPRDCRPQVCSSSDFLSCCSLFWQCSCSILRWDQAPGYRCEWKTRYRTLHGFLENSERCRLVGCEYDVLCNSSSRTSTIVVFLTGSCASSAGSGMELMNGEIRMAMSPSSLLLMPLVCSAVRLLPVTR